MPGNNTPTPAQYRAIEQLKGLINTGNNGGRTLCCLVGRQGSGKTWLAKCVADASEFGTTRYIAVNNIILDLIDEDPLLKEIYDFDPDTLNSDLKRFGSRLRQAVHDRVAEQFQAEGLTVLDHMELVFALGMDPITTWYNHAVGSKRILMVLTGRMALVKLYGDYQAQINAGGATQSTRRKFDLLKEMLDIPADQTDVQPKKSVIERLQAAFVEGEIRQWDAKDQVWSILCEPAELLSLYNSIPQSERALSTLFEKIGGMALSNAFELHPDFRTLYSFTADLSSAMRKRILEATWKGLVTDGDGTGKADLEKFLAPLGILNTSVSGEAAVTLSAGSDEAFRKAKERIKDN